MLTENESDEEDGPHSPLMLSTDSHGDISSIDLAQIENELDHVSETRPTDLESKPPLHMSSPRPDDDDMSPLHASCENNSEGFITRDDPSRSVKRGNRFKPMEFQRLETDMSDGMSEDSDSSALVAGGIVNIYKCSRIGYLLQYFAVGIIYGTVL
jgi:hypothetical protein